MHCAICKRELSEDEPVYRVIIRWGGSRIVSACAGCEKRGGFAGRWPSAKPCDRCGRPVFVNRQRSPLYFVCGDKCRIAIYNTNARKKLKARKQYLTQMIPKKRCAVCDEQFTPKRSDAMYCSSACKQGAYRSRMQ